MKLTKQQLTEQALTIAMGAFTCNSDDLTPLEVYKQLQDGNDESIWGELEGMSPENVVDNIDCQHRQIMSLFDGRLVVPFNEEFIVNLRNQKRFLLDMGDNPHAIGLINLLDFMQDQLVDLHGLPESSVFPDTRVFLLEDKSGRGATGKCSGSDLLQMPQIDRISDNTDESLADFSRDADTIGDKWEIASLKVTLIQI